MATIYRIEDKGGYGLYCSLNDKVKLTSLAEPRHPMPWNDEGLKPHVVGHSPWVGIAWKKPANKWDLRYGFATLDQLRFWIYKQAWRDRLDEVGALINVYEAPDCLIGQTQAVFNLKTASKTGNIEWKDL